MDGRSMTDPRLFSLLAIIALIILSALFSASEAALLAMSRLRLLQRTDDSVSRSLTELLDDRNRYLTTMLIGNTIVLLAADSVATWLAIQLGVASPVLVATVVMTLAVLIFAEILPKMIAVQDPMRWAPRLAWFLRGMRVVLAPVTWALVGVTSGIIRLFGGDPKAHGPYVTEDDIRALLVALSRGELSKPLRELMRPVKAIPETKKVDELIREMQAEKVSVAIVVDEYGGTAGLVTMEDLLEEIVGEIMDEYDVGEHDTPAEIKHLADGDAVVDARMSIEDVNEELGLHLPTEDFESIGGYAFGQFGRVPLPGDEISLAPGVTLVVEETAGRRLRSVRIKKAGPTNGAAAATDSERSMKPANRHT